MLGRVVVKLGSICAFFNRTLQPLCGLGYPIRVVVLESEGTRYFSLVYVCVCVCVFPPFCRYPLLVLVVIAK